MKNLAAIFITSILIITVTTPANAEVSLFVGASTDGGIPGCFRLGINSWEFGFITERFIGADQVFRSGSTYAAWGVGYVFGETAGGGGFYAGVGWEPKLFWGLTFRGELNAIAGTNAYVRGGLHAGLGYHF